MTIVSICPNNLILRLFFSFSVETLVHLKVIGAGIHQLVLQHVSMAQTGEYRSLRFPSLLLVNNRETRRCQVTLDKPPFRFHSASSPLTVMVLPERHPVISGLSTKTPSAQPTHLGYLPGDKLAINCTAAPSHPGASLTWLVNRRRVDRWMVTSYLPITYPSGLTSSVLGLSFLVLAEVVPLDNIWGQDGGDKIMSKLIAALSRS